MPNDDIAAMFLTTQVSAAPQTEDNPLLEDWKACDTILKEDSTYANGTPAPAPQTDAVEKASVPDFGICKEKGCKEKATVDYNGHGYFVCKMHYKLLNDEFDEEYK